MIKKFLPLVSLLSLLAAPATVQAAHIVFDNSSSPTVLVGISDFEFGFYLNGNLFQQGLGSASTSLLESDSPISFSGSWLDLGQSGSGSRTIYIVAPGTDDIVDAFSYNWSTDGSQGSISGTFSAGAGLGTVPVGTNPADVFQADAPPAYFSLAFLDGTVQGPASGVPETLNTGAVMGVVLAGMVGIRSVRRRKTA